MDNTFTKGQIVRFKGYKRRPDEKEAYFVVIQEATPYSRNGTLYLEHQPIVSCWSNGYTRLPRRRFGN